MFHSPRDLADALANSAVAVAPQVAVDFSQERKTWMDMIRVWCIHIRHDNYDKTLAGR
jgi:hypothetical protein